jgi:1-acyl-sn-glycerol-3-phosphate acyltransferase
MDPFFIYLAAKRPMTAAGKADLWAIKPLLPLIYAMRAVKIDRSNDRETAKSILNGIKFMKEDNSIIIFPEGGIKTREVEQMVSLKAGAYKLATKSEAIIQPAAIIGSSKLAKRKPWQWFKIIVRFLPAIYPADYAGLTTHEIGYKVIDMVNKEFPHEEKFQIEESNEL